MNIDQVKKDIEKWIVDFVEVPHPALGGFPPCPYARSSRLKQSYDIFIGSDPYFDLKNRAKYGMGNKEVVVYVYDPKEWSHDLFASSLDQANRDFLLAADILALEDHPDDVEIVNGICMNQGTYAMALVQSLSDLDTKAQLMAKRGFYDTWPEDYLTGLFQHRKDPRL